MQVTLQPGAVDSSSMRVVTSRSQSVQNTEPTSGCRFESMNENFWAAYQYKVKTRSFQERDPNLSTILKHSKQDKSQLIPIL